MNKNHIAITKLNESQSMGHYLAAFNNLSDADRITINKIIRYLKSQGIQRGDSVAIISNTRIEWVLSDLAIILLGAVSVSVYQSLTPHEIAYILYDSNTSFIFIENQEQLLKINEIFSRTWNIPKVEDRPAKEIRLECKGCVSFENVSDVHTPFALKQLSELPSIKEDAVFYFNERITRDDIASIVYTSGTTGVPKGVVQTHGNHLSNVRQVLESGLMLETGAIFLFLPLAHSFGRLMAYVSIFSQLALRLPRVSDSRTSKIDNTLLAEDLRESNAEIIPVVPRLLEKIKAQIEALSHKKNVSGSLLSLTLKVAPQRVRRLSVFARILHFLLFPIRKKICRRIFGTNFKYAVSGGAKLPVSVHHFFEDLGITIVQGYGLTETCVATNACRPRHNKIGSVGPVLSPDIEIKILLDGEIAFRGPNIAKGYHNRPQATKESWTEDGWFLTGDLGECDSEGFLFITGRKKELIATSGGKKIAPLPIEEMILEHKIFSQAVVVGEGRKYLSVILFLNSLEVEKSIGNSIDKPNSDKIDELIRSALESVNEKLASFESIKKYICSPFEFTVDNSFMTPSHKIKRNEVEKYFKNEIELLYVEDN